MFFCGGWICWELGVWFYLRFERISSNISANAIIFITSSLSPKLISLTDAGFVKKATACSVKLWTPCCWARVCLAALWVCQKLGQTRYFLISNAMPKSSCLVGQSHSFWTPEPQRRQELPLQNHPY